MSKIEKLPTSQFDDVCDEKISSEKNVNIEIIKDDYIKDNNSEENELIIKNHVIYNDLESGNDENEENEENNYKELKSEYDIKIINNIKLENEINSLLIIIENLKNENLELKNKIENINKIDLLLKLKENISNKINDVSNLAIESGTSSPDLIVDDIKLNNLNNKITIETQEEKIEENTQNNEIKEQDINLVFRKRRGRHF
jgi:hypothetical protein